MICAPYQIALLFDWWIRRL